MNKLRVHRKVWLAWGRWWAMQLAPEWMQLGIHVELRRPLLDLYIGPLTLAFGNHPALTDIHTAQRHSCRGFFIGNYPDEAVF